MVVDVDVVGERGHAIADEVVAWCVSRGAWHLVRPSGGADGRAHVLTVPGGHAAALEDLVDDVRRRWRASRTAVDLRIGGRAGKDGLRPLSAPHRSGVMTRPLGHLDEALRALRQVLPPDDSPAAGRRRAPRGARTAVPPPAESPFMAATPLPPRPRKHLRPVPAEWEHYLATGQAPIIPGEDQSRSALEAVCTGHLLRAGYDAEQAWARAVAAHPDAMARDRTIGSKGYQRWVWVWNRAVQADNAWRDEHGTAATEVDPAIGHAIRAARARLEAAVWAAPPRRRPTLLRVGDVLLDRMGRTSTSRVPCPERNLLQDTGVASRDTVRAALHELDAAGVLRLHQVFDADRRETSSHEVSIALDQVIPAGVSETSPPALDPPCAAHGGPRGLPRLAYALWRALHLSSAALSAEVLCQAAFLTTTSTADASESQVRRVREVLGQMARVGLAQCTEDGTWVPGTGPTAAYAAQVEQEHQEVSERIEQERVEYRSRAATAWSVGRAAAYKQQRAKEVAWWGGLDPAERARRRTRRREEFAQLPVVDQERAKYRWAARRVIAGEHEPTRHDQWLDGQPMDHVVRESVQRAAEFGRLPFPLRRAKAEAWARHRDTFDLARGTPLATSRLEHAALLPTTTERDSAFLHAEASRGPTLFDTA